MSVCVSDTEEDIETGGTTDVTIPESKNHPPPELSTGMHIITYNHKVFGCQSARERSPKLPDQHGFPF